MVVYFTRNNLEDPNKAIVLANKQSYKKQASNISGEIVRWEVSQNKAPELLRKCETQ